MTETPVTIDLAFRDPPDGGVRGSSTTQGGIRVRVGAEVLTAVEGEFDGKRGGSVKKGDDTTPVTPDRYAFSPSGEPIDDPRGFRGTWLAPALVGLLDSAAAVVEAHGWFPEKRVDLMTPSGATLVLSYLDGEHVRVAFQHAAESESSSPTPPVDRALGRVVAEAAVCEAVADAGAAYCEYARAEGWGEAFEDETNTAIEAGVERILAGE